MATEAEARSILFQEERAAALVGIVESAWQAHVGENRHRSTRTRASLVWDYMAQFADRSFATLPGVTRVEVAAQLPLYICDDRIAVRFKKLNRELSTRNVLTEQQRRIAAQLSLDGMVPLTYVSVGYVLDRAEASIERVMAVKHIRTQLEWSIDLRELAEGELEPVAPILPLAPAGTPDARPLPRIVPPAKEEGDPE